MAEDKKIIIEVELDSKQAQKEAERLTGEIAAQREELKAWRKILKDSGGTNKQAAQEVAKLSSQIKQNSKALNQATKEANAEDNSINALRASVSKLTAERNQLNTATTKGKKRFEELTGSILEQTNKLKELEGAVGDTRRNVGNYKADMLGALKANSLFSDSLGDAGAGFDALVKAASPVALVIGLIVGAISVFFSRSREGRQTLERLQAVAKATFGVILDLISNSVKAIRDFVAESESIGDFFSRLGDVILENLKNRIDGIIKTFGILGDALSALVQGEFEQAKKATEGLATAIAQVYTGASEEALEKFADDLVKAATNADNLAKANIRLRASIRANTIAASEAQRDAEKFRKSRDDEFKTLEDRLELNKKVLKAEEERLKAQSAINKARQAIISNEIALGGGQVNATEEQLTALAELRAEAAEIEEDFLGRTTEQLTEANAIRKEEAQAQLTFEKELLNTRILQEDLVGKKLLDAKLSILEKEKQAELIGIQAGSVEAKAIEQDFYNQRLELLRDFKTSQAEITATADATETERLKGEFAKREKARKDALTEQQQIAEASAMVEQLKLDAIRGITTSLISVFGEESAAGKIAFLIDKSLAIADIITKGQVAAAGLTASLLSNPITAPLLPAALTANTIRTVTSVATVAATVPQGVGFAEGGYTGDGGKYQPAGVVHRGEIVIPQTGVKAMGGASQAMGTISSLGGFASGGIVGSRMSAQSRVPNAINSLSNDISRLQVQVAVTDINKASGKYNAIQAKVNS